MKMKARSLNSLERISLSMRSQPEDWNARAEKTTVERIILLNLTLLPRLLPE